MDLGIKGRVALVTGGSQGIGLAIAAELLHEGASVMICARGQDRLAEAEAELAELGVVRSVVADVRRRADVESAVARTVEQLGGIDILVNNAGGVTNFGGYDDLDDADWLEAYELNLLSAVNAARAAVPHMRAQGWGRIVNLASESAVQPDAFIPHYAAQKAALLSMSKSLSRELAGSGILVNAVSPAFTKTPILESLLSARAEEEGIDVVEAEKRFLREQRPNITVGRSGDPSEVAQIVVVLCSEVASFVNGSNVRVDAGSVSTIS